jgi:hypothetical protein
LGKVCAEQGEFKESAQALKKLSELAPIFIDIYYATMPPGTGLENLISLLL